MYLKLSTVFEFLNATSTSRCFLEGERVLEANHIIQCGLKKQDSDKYDIVAYCLQSSAIKKEPHELRGIFRVMNAKLAIESFQCSCKAGMSSCCKHVSATLLYCTRTALENLPVLATTDVKCLWKDRKPKTEANYLPKPLKETQCFKVKMTRPAEEFAEDVKIKIFTDITTACPHSTISKDLKGRRTVQTVTMDTCASNDACVPEDTKIIIENAKNSSFWENVTTTIYPLNSCCEKTLLEAFKDEAIKAACCKQGGTQWKLMRQHRITGTSCYSLSTYVKNEWDKKAKSFFQKKSVQTKEMLHGIEQEVCALEAYQQDNPQFIIKYIGLLICHKYPWLSYSPDGIIFEKNQPTKLLEIKCPYRG
ncbi:hypothetical protein Zmor_006017 [Zophobas morio]|uniref:SWIM-type domain-containing protein n=1 Tax=Zophobas morio TaxID=2755281 RepID=A0AA38MML5_9CUCU|nr:hypothetical protein Zmor_006017 [Zophobas morio]